MESISISEGSDSLINLSTYFLSKLLYLLTKHVLIPERSSSIVDRTLAVLCSPMKTTCSCHSSFPQRRRQVGRALRAQIAQLSPQMLC